MKLLVLQHIACEHLGSIADALEERKVGYKYVRLFEGKKIPEQGYSGLVILGGPMNVYEEERYPFLKEENDLIKKALAKNIPVLGICLGAQLIAKAAGARVIKGKQKEIGWYTVKLMDEGSRDEIFEGFEEEFKVFQWHGDTFEIPKGGIKLATSELFQNQAFRIGSVYALQFHLEVTYEMIEEWIKEYKDELSSLKINPSKILRDTKLNIRRLNEQAGLLYQNFFDCLHKSLEL